jgi:hypothetical protein
MAHGPCSHCLGATFHHLGASCRCCCCPCLHGLYAGDADSVDWLHGNGGSELLHRCVGGVPGEGEGGCEGRGGGVSGTGNGLTTMIQCSAVGCNAKV